MSHKEALQKDYLKFSIYIYKIRTQVIRQYIGCTGYHGWDKSINKLFVKFLTKLILSTADCSTPSAWNTCNWTQRQLWYSIWNQVILGPLFSQNLKKCFFFFRNIEKYVWTEDYYKSLKTRMFYDSKWSILKTNILSIWKMKWKNNIWTLLHKRRIKKLKVPFKTLIFSNELRN